jgi:hypothetical protein
VETDENNEVAMPQVKVQLEYLDKALDTTDKLLDSLAVRLVDILRAEVQEEQRTDKDSEMVPLARYLFVRTRRLEKLNERIYNMTSLVEL